MTELVLPETVTGEPIAAPFDLNPYSAHSVVRATVAVKSTAVP
ncbi:hypothetical protein ACSW29_02615 [Rhodococcus sp. GB-02]